MQRFADICFARDHATAAGHFPGNPIIPGALLLDEVVQAITDHIIEDGTIVIRSAKFFRVVRPGDIMRLQWHPLADGAIAFECHLLEDDAPAATGTITIGPKVR